MVKIRKVDLIIELLKTLEKENRHVGFIAAKLNISYPYALNLITALLYQGKVTKEKIRNRTIFTWGEQNLINNSVSDLQNTEKI